MLDVHDLDRWIEQNKTVASYSAGDVPRIC
jgi:hypothetical protein